MTIDFATGIAFGKRLMDLEYRIERLEKRKEPSKEPLFSAAEIEEMRRHNRVLDWLMEPKYTFWFGADA